MPDPQVNLTLDKPQYNIGDTANFTCTAEINSTYIDKDITVTMEINNNITPPKKQDSQYSSTYAVAITDTTVATQYTCTVTITSTSQYIISSNGTKSTNLRVIGKIGTKLLILVYKIYFSSRSHSQHHHDS